MSIVKGENVILFAYDSGIWKMGACFKSVTLNISTSMTETTVSGNGPWASFAPQKHSFTGSAEGIVSLNMPGMLTLADFRAKQIAKEMLLMRYQRTDSQGNLYTDECRFFISNSSDNSSFDNVDLFTLEMQGTGAINQVYTPTTTISTNKVKRYEYTGIGGETGFTEALLYDKDVLEVVKDGLGNSGIILTGTPVNKEVKYTNDTVNQVAEFEWAVSFEVGEKAYILYQDK